MPSIGAATAVIIADKINRLPVEEREKATKWYALTARIQFIKMSPYLFGLLIGMIACWLLLLGSTMSPQLAAGFTIGVSIIAGSIIRKCLAKKLTHAKKSLVILLRNPEMTKILPKIQIKMF